MAMLVGCGRLGFDGGDASPAGEAGVIPDAPPGTMYVTFGETPGADHANVTIDTFLDSTAPTTVRGGASTSLCDLSPQRNVLVRFDVSALAPTTTVLAAELEVEVMNTAASPTNDVFEVLESWTEDAATWQNRLVGTPWTTIGGSRGTTALGTFAALARTSRLVIPLDAGGVSVVQHWVNDPTANHGFALVSEAGSWDLATRDHGTEVYRPLLRLTVPVN